jgi:hypothetical protein
MAAKKRSGKTRVRQANHLEGAGRGMRIFSTAVGSVVNMTMTVVTSASVLLCLFAAKRLL